MGNARLFLNSCFSIEIPLISINLQFVLKQVEMLAVFEIPFCKFLDFHWQFIDFHWNFIDVPWHVINFHCNSVLKQGEIMVFCWIPVLKVPWFPLTVHWFSLTFHWCSMTFHLFPLKVRPKTRGNYCICLNSRFESSLFSIDSSLIFIDISLIVHDISFISIEIPC